MRIRARLILALTPLGGLLGACSYTFGNSAEALQAGQVSGRVLADRNGSGTPAPFGGVSVSLRGSAFDQVTHATGRFTVLPLPAGRHALLFRRNTVWALSRDVEVGFGKDGQLEGVAMGDVVLRYSAAVSGAVAPTSGLTEGLAVDEATGQPAPISGGRFTFPVLPLGGHVIHVVLRDPLGGAQWVGGPATVALTEADQQTERQLAPVAVHAASPGATGRIHFRIATVGLSLAPGAVTVTGLPAGATVSGPDSNGDVEADLPEGLYVIGLTAPASAAGALAPAVATTVVLADQLSDLGTQCLVLDSAVTRAQLSCAADADCPGGSCTTGACTGWSPPAAAPASVPWCDPAAAAAGTACSGAGVACLLPGGLAGACAPSGAATGAFLCVSCGGCCTPDGTAQLCASLSLPACP